MIDSPHAASVRNENSGLRGYNPGHPWFYRLGGTVQKPKQILAVVRTSCYQGYRSEDIQKADSKDEPKRSSALRILKQSALNDLHSDLERYRQLARQYYDCCRIDKAEREAQPICSDICMSMSLKYNHLYNDFAHLVVIDDLLSQQPDLFGY